MIKMVKTPYFFRFDSDDIMHPDRLRIQLGKLSSGDFDLCGSSISFIDANSDRLPSSRFGYPKTDFLIRLIGSIYNNPFAHPAVSGKSHPLYFIGGYKENPPYEDYHLWSQYSSSFNLHNLSTPLLYYRLHSKQITQTKVVPYVKLVLVRLNFLKNFLLKYPYLLIISPVIFLLALISLGFFVLY